MEPDFTHTVEVYNITSGGRQEVGNITDSIFTFTLCEVESQTNGSNGDGMNQTNGSRCTLVNSDPSNMFKFIVTAVNAVGRGKPSEVNATFLQGLLSYTVWTFIELHACMYSTCRYVDSRNNARTNVFPLVKSSHHKKECLQLHYVWLIIRYNRLFHSHNTVANVCVYLTGKETSSSTG